MHPAKNGKIEPFAATQDGRTKYDARLLPGTKRRASLDVISLVSEHRFRDVLLTGSHSRDIVPPEVFCAQHFLKLGGLHREHPILSRCDLGWCFLRYVAVRIGDAVLREPDTVPRGATADNLARRLHSIRVGA